MTSFGVLRRTASSTYVAKHFSDHRRKNSLCVTSLPPTPRAMWGSATGTLVTASRRDVGPGIDENAHVGWEEVTSTPWETA